MYRTVISLRLSCNSTLSMLMREIHLLHRLFCWLGVTRKVLSIILVLADVSLVQTLYDLLLRLIVISRLGLQVVLITLFVGLVAVMGVVMVSSIVLYSILSWMSMGLERTGIVALTIQIVTTWLSTLLLGCWLPWLLYLVLCCLEVAADEVVTILMLRPGLILGVACDVVLRILILIHFKLTLTFVSWIWMLLINILLANVYHRFLKTFLSCWFIVFGQIIVESFPRTRSLIMRMHNCRGTLSLNSWIISISSFLRITLFGVRPYWWFFVFGIREQEGFIEQLFFPVFIIFDALITTCMIGMIVAVWFVIVLVVLWQIRLICKVLSVVIRTIDAVLSCSLLGQGLLSLTVVICSLIHKVYRNLNIFNCKKKNRQRGFMKAYSFLGAIFWGLYIVL